MSLIRKAFVIANLCKFCASKIWRHAHNIIMVWRHHGVYIQHGVYNMVYTWRQHGVHNIHVLYKHTCMYCMCH